MLLTRSRLCPGASPGSSLHLHVLSTPPAFVLSQDQTLREVNFMKSAAEPCGASEYTVETPAQRRLNASWSCPPDREGRIRSNLDALIGPPAGDRVCMLLSFQRPARP